MHASILKSQPPLLDVCETGAGKVDFVAHISKSIAPYCIMRIDYTIMEKWVLPHNIVYVGENYFRAQVNPQNNRLCLSITSAQHTTSRCTTTEVPTLSPYNAVGVIQFP